MDPESLHTETPGRDEEIPSGSSEASPIDAALQGAQGGIVATAVMTVYRLPVFRALPPTADFWAKYVGGGEPEDHLLQGLVLHFLYGAGGGVPFGVAFARLGLEPGAERRRAGLVLGIAYGLLLSVFGTRVIFRRLLEEDLDDDESFVFVVGHVVYGIALGTWMSSRRGFGDVYD